MPGNLTCLDQQGDHSQQHASKGGIMHKHLLKTVWAHMHSSNCSCQKEDEGSWPPQFAIQKMHHSSLHSLLVNLLSTLFVPLHIIPLLIYSSIPFRQHLSTMLTGQDQFLDKGRSQAEQSFLIGGLHHFFWQFLDDFLQLLWVWLGGCYAQVGSDDPRDVREVDQVSEDIQDRSFQKDCTSSFAQQCYESQMRIALPFSLSFPHRRANKYAIPLAIAIIRSTASHPSKWKERQVPAMVTELTITTSTQSRAITIIVQSMMHQDHTFNILLQKMGFLWLMG